MNKLAVIRLGINNTEKAIKELENQLQELRVLEQVALLEEEVDRELEEVK